MKDSLALHKPNLTIAIFQYKCTRNENRFADLKLNGHTTVLGKSNMFSAQMSAAMNIARDGKF